MLRIARPTLFLSLIALALIAPGSASAAKSCASGKILWVVGGKATCLKTARPKIVKTSPGDRMSRLILDIAKPKPGSKFRFPRAVRKAIPVAAKSASKLTTKALAAPFKPVNKRALGRRAVIAGASPVIERIEMSTPEIKGPEGTTIQGKARFRAHEDDTVEGELVYEISKDGVTYEISPHLEATNGIPRLGCPTPDGILKLEYTTTTGTTAIARKGKSVKKAITEKKTETMRVTGHVGRDAKLASVEGTFTTKTERYERGLQLVIKVTGDAEITREGQPQMIGTNKADVSVKAAGASRAAEREWERENAAAFASNPQNAKDFGSSVDLMRWAMLRDEYKWYQLPNYCARIDLTPGSATLAEGKSITVDGVVEATGGESPGTFTIASVERGSFSATKANSDPGSPAKLTATATAAAPGSDRTTVSASMIATSPGGRAQATWTAEDDEIVVPESFSGAIVSQSSTTGLLDKFSMIATWELQSKTPGPNGFAQAWYELTEIILESSSNEIGSGCRWKAEGTNGTINAGDLELRRPKAGAGWTYAFLVDVSVLNATFVPTDCPPGSGLEPFTGDIVSVLNSHKIGAPFRPVDTSHDDFRMIEEDQTDVIGPAGLDTLASWAIYSYR